MGMTSAQSGSNHWWSATARMRWAWGRSRRWRAVRYSAIVRCKNMYACPPVLGFPAGTSTPACSQRRIRSSACGVPGSGLPAGSADGGGQRGVGHPVHPALTGGREREGDPAEDLQQAFPFLRGQRGRRRAVVGAVGAGQEVPQHGLIQPGPGAGQRVVVAPGRRPGSRSAPAAAAPVPCPPRPASASSRSTRPTAGAGRSHACTAARVSCGVNGSSSASRTPGSGGPAYPASREVSTHRAVPWQPAAHCRSRSCSRLPGAWPPAVAASRGTSSRASTSSTTPPAAMRSRIRAADRAASSPSATR